MKINPYVQVKKSGIHNRGVFAKTDIPKDTPIIQYVGDKLTYKEADKRADARQDSHIYLFTLNSRYIIDGDVSYNPAKYINHSCDPNCYVDIIKNEIWIYALRDIKKGEELGYDYGFQRPDWHEHPCRCGAKNCFGFIVDSTHWASIRKTKRYQRLRNKS